MPFGSTNYRVYITAPTVLEAECRAAVEVISEWSRRQHLASQLVALIPIPWQANVTDVDPKLPEEADALVALFGDRPGSDSQDVRSCPVRTLERFASANKPVLAYFSNSAAGAHEAKPKKNNEAQRFRSSFRGISGEFASVEVLRAKLHQHLFQLADSLQHGSSSRDRYREEIHAAMAYGSQEQREYIQGLLYAVDDAAVSDRDRSDLLDLLSTFATEHIRAKQTVIGEVISLGFFARMEKHGVRYERKPKLVKAQKTVAKKPKRSVEVQPESRHEDQSAQVRRTMVLRRIRVFLASSHELRPERDELDRYLREQNDWLQDNSVYLQVDRCENFLDAMSPTRLQDEYNRAVCDCHIFLGMFWTKIGKYTLEEFTKAHEHFKVNGTPKIYTYFKDPRTSPNPLADNLSELFEFRTYLEKQLGHYPTHYDSIDQLKLSFHKQLDKLLKGDFFKAG